mmetsp:Transcript_35730/g.84660  ORF Transcript_35730/g.84660 Transcript_35730/m.84660 type:complete len:85 (-) Transcript_35730:444-698(-)
MPSVKVLFFARARELVGASSDVLQVPEGSTSHNLHQNLLERYPELKEIERDFVLALNQEYIEPGAQHVLNEADEVAVIPPISGG